MAVLTVALGLPGCGAFRGGPSGFELSQGELTPDSLVALVNRQASATSSVRGSGKMRVVTPEYPKGRQLDISLVARRPDLVRIQGRVGLLASIFDFVADPDSLRLYLPRDRAAVVQANTTSAALMSIVASRELVEAILPPPIDEAAAGVLVRHGPEGWIVTRRRGTGECARLYRSVYDDKRLRLLEIAVRPAEAPDADPEVRIHYSRHAWTGRTWFPGEIRLELPAESRSVTLAFQTFEPNPVLGPAVFQLILPPGTRRLDPEELNDDFLRSAGPAE